MRTLGTTGLRLAAILAVVLLSVTAAIADPLHDAWVAFAAPVLDPESHATVMDTQRARGRAITLLQGLKPQTVRASEALAYFHLRNYQYQIARELLEGVAKRNGREPRIRFLLGQTKAVLLLADPEKMGEQCKEPIGEFRRAANLEPDNAVPLLQAASVAFDCNRADLALPLVTEALKRPACRLYSVPAPEDLSPDGAKAAAAWFWVQSSIWQDAISRMTNCARWLTQLADRDALRGDKESAANLYRQAVAVADLLMRSSPPLAASLGAGLESKRQVLTAQSGTLQEETTLRPQLDAIAATQLRLQSRREQLRRAEQQSPPNSVQAIMEGQRRLVEDVTQGREVPNGTKPEAG